MIYYERALINLLCFQGNADLRQLEGPSLHKSLLSFVDVVGSVLFLFLMLRSLSISLIYFLTLRKLASPIKAAYAPFRSSKLTHYISESVGGNSIVIGVALLHPGEPEVTRKTMEVLERLGSARCVYI
jgi:hypothetical protein